MITPSNGSIGRQRAFEHDADDERSLQHSDVVELDQRAGLGVAMGVEDDLVGLARPNPRSQAGRPQALSAWAWCLSTTKSPDRSL